MKGKFNSPRDAVAYRASLDGSHIDEMGDVDTYGAHLVWVNLYGWDAIVCEDSAGFVSVDWFRDTFTDPDGTVWRSAECGNRWCELADAVDMWGESAYCD